MNYLTTDEKVNTVLRIPTENTQAINARAVASTPSGVPAPVTVQNTVELGPSGTVSVAFPPILPAATGNYVAFARLQYRNATAASQTVRLLVDGVLVDQANHDGTGENRENLQGAVGVDPAVAHTWELWAQGATGDLFVEAGQAQLILEEQG